jgi:hypothetical protein
MSVMQPALLPAALKDKLERMGYDLNIDPTTVDADDWTGAGVSRMDLARIRTLRDSWLGSEPVAATHFLPV